MPQAVGVTASEAEKDNRAIYMRLHAASGSEPFGATFLATACDEYCCIFVARHVFNRHKNAL